MKELLEYRLQMSCEWGPRHLTYFENLNSLFEKVKKNLTGEERLAIERIQGEIIAIKEAAKACLDALCEDAQRIKVLDRRIQEIIVDYASSPSDDFPIRNIIILRDAGWKIHYTLDSSHLWEGIERFSCALTGLWDVTPTITKTALEILIKSMRNLTLGTQVYFWSRISDWIDAYGLSQEAKNLKKAISEFYKKDAEKLAVNKIYIPFYSKINFENFRAATYLPPLQSSDIYRLGFANLDSARQSQIEALRSERRIPAPIGQGEEEDRFGKVAASPNSQNLTGRGIQPFQEKPKEESSAVSGQKKEVKSEDVHSDSDWVVVEK